MTNVRVYKIKFFHFFIQIINKFKQQIKKKNYNKTYLSEPSTNPNKWAHQYLLSYESRAGCNYMYNKLQLILQPTCSLTELH